MRRKIRGWHGHHIVMVSKSWPLWRRSHLSSQIFQHIVCVHVCDKCSVRISVEVASSLGASVTEA